MATALLLYGRTLSFAFVGESAAHFRWMEGQDLVSLFTAKFWIYRPLVFVLWKALRGLSGGYDVLLFHLPNVTALALGGVLVYLIARSLVSDLVVATLAGMFFVSHPYQIQLAWVEVLFHPLMAALVLASVYLYMRGTEGGRTRRRVVTGSVLLLVLAFLSHEASVVGIGLVALYDVLYNAGPLRRRVLRIAPLGVATVAYLAWWNVLPVVGEFSPLPATDWNQRLGNLPPALQPFVLPVAPLALILHNFSSLPSWATLLIWALPTLVIIGVLLNRVGQGRIFVFCVGWWLLGVLPPAFLLSTAYVNSGLRLFTLAAGAAAILWASVVVALADVLLGTLRSTARRFAALASGASIVVVSWSLVATWLGDFSNGSEVGYQISGRGAAGTKEGTTVFVNLPKFRAGKAPFPYGDFGMVIMHDYVPLEDLVYVHSGQERTVQGVTSHYLTQAISAARPSEQTLLWSYFTYGDPVDPAAFLRIGLGANQLHLFDPRDWRLEDLQTFDVRWPPLDLIRRAEAWRDSGGRVYVLSQDPFTSSASKGFDPSQVLVLPSGTDHASYLVTVGQSVDLLEQLKRLYPEGRVVWGPTSDPVETAAFRIGAGETPFFEARAPMDVTLGDAIQLEGYELIEGPYRPGDRMELTLYWTTQAPTDRAYTVFTHLTGPADPSTGSSIWGQWDSQPGSGSYPTQVWEPGEVVVDRYLIPVSPYAPPGSYQLEVGMYLLETGHRLPVMENGRPIGDRIVLGSVQLRRG